MNPSRFLTVCLAVAAAGIASSAFAASADPLAAVRDLGVQIKNVADRASTSHAPSSGDMSNFERRIGVLSVSVAQDNDPIFRTKLQSIAMLLGNLKFAAAHPAQSATHLPTRADLDIEQVAVNHGNACASALGISNALPVRLTLGATGNGSDSAWFRYESPADGHVRFATDSSGADPALAVFTSCTPGSTTTAQNDDAIGLDAAITVTVTGHRAIYVHLTNSGNVGPVILSVADANATLTGSIIDATSGQPISGALVLLEMSNGNGYTGINAQTNPSGSYSMSAPAGSYFVYVQAPQYLSQLYPNASCPYNSYFYNYGNCNLSAAQTVVLSSGVTTSGINMAMSSGYEIAGQVHDDSNQPIAQAYVTLYDGNGNQLSMVTADSIGRYTFATLPPGTYKLDAQANGYGSQMFDHVACTGTFQDQCNLGSANAVVISNQNVSAANFNLTVLPAITGKLSGSGLQTGSYYNSQVSVLDAFGNTIASAYTDQNGKYRVGPLQPGNYFVTASTNGYFSQIFNGVDCIQSCSSQTASATAVHIDMNTRLGQANFNLNPLPPVYGHVQDAITGAPLGNVTVMASITPPSTFRSITSALTDSNGNYTLNALPAGKYYLWAQSTDHIDQVYSGIDCEALPAYYGSGNASCDVTGATLLTIAPGSAPGTFNFAMHPGSAISGQAVIRADTGSDLPAQTQISIYNGSGVLVAAANTDANGNYIVNDLEPDTYFASAGVTSYGYSAFIMQVWNMIDCQNQCAPTAGTPITVLPVATTPDINFNLIATNAVVGRITDEWSHPLPGIIVDLFDSTNNNHLASAATDANGFYAATYSANTSYFVATDSSGSYVDQVYSGISCPAGPAYLGLCPLTNATSVTVGSNVMQPVIVDFALRRPDLIFKNGFE